MQDRTGCLLWCGLGLWLVAAGGLEAAPQAFDFKDKKGVNAVSFVLDSVVEPIMGLATGIAGEIEFDPKDVKSMTGQIEVDAKQIRTSNERMTKVLHSSDWLDVEEYPSVTFEFSRVKSAKKRDGAWNMKVMGAFTLKGVTKKMTVPIQATYLEDGLGDRMRGREGDLLVLRSTFTIKRADFDIKPEMGGKVVAEEIEIRVIVVGGTFEE